MATETNQDDAPKAVVDKDDAIKAHFAKVTRIVHGIALDALTLSRTRVLGLSVAITVGVPTENEGEMRTMTLAATSSEITEDHLLGVQQRTQEHLDALKVLAPPKGQA